MYTREKEVEVASPVLVMGMEGWIDAGLGGAGALAAVLNSVDTDVIGRFDSDMLLDHRSRRPTLRVVDGVNMGLRWPDIELRAGKDGAGHDVLVLVGPEPDHLWRGFTDTVVGVAREMGVRLAVALGAFPAPVAHTRPVKLSSTATSEELAAKVGFVAGAIEVPAGIHSALERGFLNAGIPAVGLWARVPHYVAGMPYPAASVALVEGLAEIAGLELDPGDLSEAAEVTNERIEELIARSPEHQEMVSRLESQLDAEGAGGDGAPLRLDNLPSGDEIAEELQRFLRGETS